LSLLVPDRLMRSGRPTPPVDTKEHMWRAT